VNLHIAWPRRSFCQQNTTLSSFIDGAGMGLGFTMALGILGSIRENLGETGLLFGYKSLSMVTVS
jgi:electron transport complex protein RnfE